VRLSSCPSPASLPALSPLHPPIVNTIPPEFTFFFWLERGERRGGALTVLKHLTLRPLQPPIALILAFVMALLWWLVLVVCCCRVLMW